LAEAGSENAQLQGLDKRPNFVLTFSCPEWPSRDPKQAVVGAR